MIRKLKNFLFFLTLATLASCDSTNDSYLSQATITTNRGDITFVLLNETPLHRSNFIELAEDGFYDNMQFHRVIKNFVIQTGNTNSKHLSPDSTLLDGGAEHIVKAEFLDEYKHVRGVVAAARLGDDENPERNSSGSHFYIVQGNNQNQLDSLSLTLRENNNSDIIDYYLKNGGNPHLDGAYTIFGYVIDGMDVVDKIAEVKTSDSDRPRENIIIEKIEITEIAEAQLKENELHKLFSKK